MAKRFGRNQKRKLQARIRELEKIAYGPYGPCPGDIESIDDLPYRSKTIRISDDPRSFYEVDVQVEVVAFDSDIRNRVEALADSHAVQFDGRCLMPVRMASPHYGGAVPLPYFTLDFKQIMAPGRRRR